LRTPVIAGNWKMNKTIDETLDFIEEFAPAVSEIDDVEIILAPTFVCLDAAADALDGTNIGLAAQDMFWKESGAYTGEVSPTMVQDAGAEYVIIGHSERRARFGVPEPELTEDLIKVFGDNDATVNRKIRAAFEFGLTPIVCVGETLNERKAGNTDSVIDYQLRRALEGITQEQARSVIMAYEPVWAIGTGEVCDAAEAGRVCGMIRSVIGELFGAQVADAVRVTYGGSVNPSNAEGLMQQQEIDGGLVGGASLKPDSFAEIVRIASRAKGA
jgi:triosephosphate isomerase